jgi:hypothetical protein
MKNYYQTKKTKTHLRNLISVCLMTILFIPAFKSQSGAALKFDGSGFGPLVNDYVTVNANPAFNITSSITIETWVNTTNFTEGYITTKNDDSWYFAINGGNTANGRITAFLNGISPGGWVVGTYSIADGNWHHVAMTYDGTKLKLFVDGLLDTQSSQTGAITTGTANVFIGTRPFYTSDRYFDGSIDELRIWNVARTQCDIQNYMRCEITSTASGLVANYHFNQGVAAGTNTVTTLTDATGQHPGTLVNFSLNGTTSNWISPGGVTSGSTTPGTTANLNFNVISSSSLICKGNSALLTAPGITSYSWSTGSNSNSISVSPTVSTTYTLTGGIGNCTGQSTVQVNVADCTGLKEFNQLSISFFPNPTQDKLFIAENGLNQQTLLEIIGWDGKLVIKRQLDSKENYIDVSTLPSGIYLIKIEGYEKQLFKFIKE